MLGVFCADENGKGIAGEPLDGRHCIDRRSTSDPFRACQSQSSRPSRVAVGLVVLVIVVNVVVVVVVVAAVVVNVVVVNVVVAEIGIRFPLPCQLQSSLHPSRVSS